MTTNALTDGTLCRHRLNFSMDFLGVLSTVGVLGAFIAAFVFRRFLLDTSFRKLLLGLILTAFCLGTSTLLLITRVNHKLGIPDKAFMFSETIAQNVCTSIALMPIVNIAAKFAPKGGEGLLYSSIMCLSNLSEVLSQALGGWLTHVLHVSTTNFTNLWLLVLLCNLTTLIPLGFLAFVPKQLGKLVKPEGTDLFPHRKLYEESEGSTESTPIV